MPDDSSDDCWESSEDFVWFADCSSLSVWFDSDFIGASNVLLSFCSFGFDSCGMLWSYYFALAVSSLFFSDIVLIITGADGADGAEGADYCLSVFFWLRAYASLAFIFWSFSFFYYSSNCLSAIFSWFLIISVSEPNPSYSSW